MDTHTYKRYNKEQQLQKQSSGNLYKGRDSILHRDVMLYISEFNENEGPRLDVIQSIKDGSQLPEDRFMHVWDIELDSHSIMIVLKPELGYFLEEELESHSLSVYEILVLIRTLGQSMQDAAKDGISGFSVHANNIWIQGANQPIIINYWSNEDPLWSEAGGLGRLLYQLIAKTSIIPANVEAMGLLLVDALGKMPVDEKEVIIKWIRAAVLDRKSLTVLLKGLDQMLLTYPEHLDMERTLSEKKLIPPIPPDPDLTKKMAAVQSPQEQFQSRSFQDTIISPPKSAPYQAKPVQQQARPVQHQPQSDPEELETAVRRSGTKKKWILAGLIILVLLIAEMLTVHLLRKPDQPSNQPVVVEKPAVPNPTPQPTTPTPAPATPKPVNEGDIVVVPNLKDMPLKEAEALLLANNLRYQFFLEANEASAGKVMRQDPPANQNVEKGTEVTFYVGK
ncbi:PASTA domain-containing protein [Paenibacillus sp. WQ 127069]|uniref:PASTA domain-containing protein n=1 Tax=Paenibacillus baimaensis TaxID=2982185 RepID=A0ABT2ULE2_9BACL|nr:PASTA domain-containing protein [Paenibacillus sp. WQ 127069]MCU6795468.1 PASTA domain-containing protein [Paenibacillus sp. WQ 127069]